MADREKRAIGSFARNQPGRNSIGTSSGGRGKSLLNQGNCVARTNSTRVTVAPTSDTPRTPGLENLKQWELVQGDRGLQVVEKRTVPSLYSPLKTSRDVKGSSPVIPEDYLTLEEELMKKFKAFEKSSIVQAVPINAQATSNVMKDSTTGSNEKYSTKIANERQHVGQKTPISLNAILKQNAKQKTADCSNIFGRSSISKVIPPVSNEGSTDTLEQLERQVKAIELGTIEAAKTDKLRESCDFESEIQLRYREHEDLLGNDTDDEADG